MSDIFTSWALFFKHLENSVILKNIIIINFNLLIISIDDRDHL